MVKRFDALNRLWESLKESNHDFEKLTETFADLDAAKVAKVMELAEKGAERGAANQPPKTAKYYDEVELAIIQRVEDEKKSSHQNLEDQLQLYGDRLTGLDFQGQFSVFMQANATSVSDFEAEIASGVDDLHGLRRDLYDAEKEREDFRVDHRLRRAARVSGGIWMGLKVTVIITVLLLETALNGLYLAKGSDQGIIGGVGEALGFAALNIGAAIVFALFLVRLLVHRSIFFKLLGLASLACYVALVVVINLALAHYREASGTLATGAGAEVINRMRDTPLALAELDSWVLFGVGTLFSIIAFIDSWFLSDPYPGYGGVEKRLQTRRSTYVDRKKDLIEDLRDIRDEHNEKVDEVIKALSDRRREHEAIVYGRTRLIALFEEHQNQLERAANVLLTLYREANRKARKEPVPKHFGEAYRMERARPVQPVSETSGVAETVRRAQEELTAQVRKIGDDFAEAVKQYHKLDNLFPGGPDAQA